MHRALFIDEILRDVFEFCLDYGQSKNTLCQVARCCKAWKDPALDRLWRQLSSVQPLLRLVPALTYTDGTYTLERPVSLEELTSFRLHARRVRHISHRRSLEISPTLTSLLESTAQSTSSPAIILPNLRTVQLLSPDDETPPAYLNLSANLKNIEITLGFRNKLSTIGKPRNVSDYMEQVVRIASGVERLSLRGLICARLNNTIASLSTLRVLCLRVGMSLTAETLTAITHFPYLAELEIQASHITVDDLLEAGKAAAIDSVTFPSLEKLHVRAQPPVIELLLDELQPGTLRILRIEAETETNARVFQSRNTTNPIISWSTTLNTVGAKASYSLKELTIEHHIDIDDLDLDMDHDLTSDTTNASIIHINTDNDTQTLDQTQNPSTYRRTCKNHLTFELIRPLSNLLNLQRFVLDTSIPPDFCDQDIERITKWWPHIKHLDFGSLAALDCQCRPHLEAHDSDLQPRPRSQGSWKPRMTLVSLATFAKTSKNLKSLILPLDIDGTVVPSGLSAIGASHALQRLTVHSVAAPDPESRVLPGFLRAIFPSLVEVDGMPEHEDEWDAIRALLTS